MTKKALNVHRKLIKKMGKQMLAIMRKEYKTDKKLREFLVETLVELNVEMHQDEWYDFICDVVRDGYKGKGISKMTLNELAVEYVDFVLGSYLNEKNYEMSFDEVKAHFENGGSNVSDTEGYEDDEEDE